MNYYLEKAIEYSSPVNNCCAFVKECISTNECQCCADMADCEEYKVFKTIKEALGGEK